MAGQTSSPDFAPDGSWHGAMDVFVLALDVIPPEASFTVSGPDARGRISVDASASKPIPGTAITGYAWDFEDGSTAAGFRAEHEYTVPGRYAVRLAVTSDRGPVGTKVSDPFVVPPLHPAALIPGAARTWGSGAFAARPATLNHLFAGGAAPPCLDAVDTNDDGSLDLSDAVNLLGYLFLAGEKPPPPFESCGPDATPDDLGCVEFTPCG